MRGNGNGDGRDRKRDESEESDMLTTAMGGHKLLEPAEPLVRGLARFFLINTRLATT